MRTLLRDLGTVSGVQCACIVRGGQVLATTFPESEAVAQAASLGFVRGISEGLELVDRGLEELQIDFQGRSLMVAPVAKDFVLAMLAAPDANTQLLRVVMGSSARQLRRMHDIAEKPAPASAATPAAPAQPAAAAPRPGTPQPPGAAPKPGTASAPPPPPPKPQPAAPAPPPQQAAKPAPTGRPQPPPPPGRPAAPPPPPPGRPGAPQPAQPAQAAQAAAAPGGAQPPKPGAKPAPAAPAAPPAAAAAASKPAEKDAEPVLPQVLALLTEYIGPVARVSFKRGVTRWRETSTPTVGTLNELAKILAADLSTDSEKKAFMDAVDRLRGS